MFTDLSCLWDFQTLSKQLPGELSSPRRVGHIHVHAHVSIGWKQLNHTEQISLIQCTMDALRITLPVLRLRAPVCWVLVRLPGAWTSSQLLLHECCQIERYLDGHSHASICWWLIKNQVYTTASYIHHQWGTNELSLMVFHGMSKDLIIWVLFTHRGLREKRSRCIKRDWLILPICIL